MKKMQYCDWCGEELGIFDTERGEFVSCGKSKCNREIRVMYKEMDDSIRYEAERDNYDRYR